ncbi:uracil-DNA glycosylase family protein, partial [Acinetobacter baumannii]
MSKNKFDSLISDIRACDICRDHLPLGPRPILQVASSAKILIAGQAPGKKVHESGIPFDDQSGERLRNWVGL